MAFLSLVTGLASGAGGHPAGGWPAPAHSVAVPPKAGPPPGAPISSPRPFAPASALYFQNDSNVSGYPANDSTGACTGTPASGYVGCVANSASPQVLRLANGDIGLTYEVSTTANATTCPNNASLNSSSRIGFARSTDGGATFGRNSYVNAIGNATCPFVSGIEPASTVQANGTIDLVYVGANTTRANLLSNYPGNFVDTYYARPSDALILQRSFDNGTTWTNGTVLLPTLIGEANLARPAIATYGQTIYIAYENISNGTALLPGTYYTSDPVSIGVIVSEDGGATWKGPFNVPGENLSSVDTANSPSLAVSSGGTLAVVYATNRSCYAFCTVPGYLATYGEDVVDITTTNNATSFSPIHRIRSVAAPSGGGGGGTSAGYSLAWWQYAPKPVATWDPATGNLYVAFTGAVNSSRGTAFAIYYDYTASEVWAGVSTDSGKNWTSRIMQVSPLSPANGVAGAYFNPGIGVENGTVYLTYTYYNETTGQGSSCSYGGVGGGLPQSYSQWVTSSKDGRTWREAVLVDLEGVDGNYAFDAYAGWYSSVAFSSTGSPVLGYSLLDDSGSGRFIYPPGYFLYLTSWNVTVATVYRGPTVQLNVSVAGIAPGAAWSFTVDGNPYNSTAPSVVVGGVPAGRGVLLLSGLAPTTLGYEVVREAVGSGVHTFTANSPWWFNVTTLVGFTLAPQPANTAYADFLLYDLSSNPSYDFEHWWSTGNYLGVTYWVSAGCPFPWYLPEGFNFTFSDVNSVSAAQATYYDFTYIGYWSGTGNGSYTGATATAPIEVRDQAINETFWMLGSGSYGVDFGAPSLPSTSTYSFDFNGSSFSGAGGTTVTAGNVSTGPHSVSHIGATSARSGWQYFGWTADDPVVVPAQPTVNLSFADVNTGTAAGLVSFRANGLTAGTVWQLAFNGTTYSSATPWINLSATHTGSYPAGAYPVVSENGSASYVPTAFGPMVNVTAGGSYLVNFTSAYQVSFVAGTGGAISGENGSLWAPPGAVLAARASVAPGFAWAGWTGLGAGSYTGLAFNISVTANGPIVETANFYPLQADRFNLTFVETGIPNGTAWTVYVDGAGFSSTDSTLSVPGVFSCALSGNLGRYTIVVPYAYQNETANLTRFVPYHYGASVCGGTTVPLAFAPEYFVTLESTAGGTVSALGLTGTSSTSDWFPGTGDALTLEASPITPAFVFVGWNGTGPGSYSGADEVATVDLVAPITEFATFQKASVAPPKHYTITFEESTLLAAGTVWEVTVNGTNYAASGSTLVVGGLLPGTYPVGTPVVFAPDGSVQYSPNPPNPTVAITSTNRSVPLSYTVAFWVALGAVGPGTVSPSSGWEPQGTSLVINASATGTAVFAGWSGQGPGAYSGPLAQTSLTVNGSLREVATFVAHAPPPGASITSIWTGPALLVGLLAGGAVVGLGVGALLARRRGGAPEPPGDDGSPPDPTEPEPGADSAPEWESPANEGEADAVPPPDGPAE